MSKLEEKAIKLLLESGKKGILQSELWHKLNVTSREGSRIAIKLEKKGIVKRVKEFANERWTRRLISLIKKINIDCLDGLPCFLCEYESTCFPSNPINSTTCIKFENWLISSFNKKKDLENKMKKNNE
jgi:DNA-binding Lrp family transcriptional regulator